MFEEQKETSSEERKETKIKLSGEIVSFVGAFSLLIGSFLYAGFKYQLYGLVWGAVFWTLAAITLALTEYLSVKKTGETISESIGKLFHINSQLFWWLWGLVAAGFIAILLHFLAMR